MRNNFDKADPATRCTCHVSRTLPNQAPTIKRVQGGYELNPPVGEEDYKPTFPEIYDDENPSSVDPLNTISLELTDYPTQFQRGGEMAKRVQEALQEKNNNALDNSHSDDSGKSINIADKQD